MEGGALSDPAFPEFSKSVVLFVHNTSRVDGEKYGGLLKEKGFGGFPTLAFMDSEGGVLTSRLERSVAGFKRSAASLAAVAELEAVDQATPLQGDAAVKLVFAQLDLGKVDFAAAKARLDKIEGAISPENKQAIAQRVVDFEIGEVFTKHQKTLTTVKPEERQAAVITMQDAVAKELAAFLPNRLPSDKNAYRFWSFLYNSAKRGGDEAMQKQAKEQLEALATRDPAQKRMVEMTLNPPARNERGTTRAVPLNGGEVPPVAIKPGGGK